MRSKLHFFSLVLIIASSLGCSDGPTQPRTQPPTQPQTEPPIDLSGPWLLAYTRGPVAKQVEVHQVGRSVTFERDRFLQFNGALSLDNLLAGQVVQYDPWESSTERYTVSGRPTPTKIELTGDGHLLTLTR